MDLVPILAQALAADPPRAQSVAGGLFGALQAAVTQKAGPEVAARVAAALPEAASWPAPAGDAARALTSAFVGGGPPVQALIAVSKLLQESGLDAAKALGVGSVWYGFLQGRLSPELLGEVTRALPGLARLGGAAGGSMFGMLGGMMGGGLLGGSGTPGSGGLPN